MGVRSYIEDVIYGRRTSLPVGLTLRLLSLVYGALVLLRGAAYRLGIVKKRKITQPVISVGNITLGGTGKTPAVMNIAGILKRRGRQPAVVSRGYGRRDESEILAVSDGQHLLGDARSGGDEPVLIGSKLAGVPVVVGSDRFKASLFAHDRFGSDSVILDDGFQHIRLKRDLDIVLIDAGDPFGNGHLFPAGILREPLSALKRSDVILVTGRHPAAQAAVLRTRIAQYTDARIFTSRFVPLDLEEVTTGERIPLSALRGARVLAAAGIARPQSFVSLLRFLEADVQVERYFADHYAYVPSDLADLYQAASDLQIGMIVTTEKDAVRMKGLNPKGIWALRIEMEVEEKDAWEELLLSKA